ncbi:MAG: TIGR04282 family arsenosugar biosynthesis glycosyltransferase [Acidobacteriota bacterium]
MEPFSTALPSRNRLLVFARVPERGLVKTRLADVLGAEKTLTIYEAMVADLLQSVGTSDESLKIEILWTGSEAVRGRTLRQYFAEYSLAQQTGETLGVRLAMAFAERIFFHRTEKVLAIGTDDPGLPRDLINTALNILESCEWVLGPAHDGGYYLIGCRASAFDPDVFENIPWGTETVFDETVRRIRGIGATLAVLPRRTDIDRLEDLQEYLQHAGTEAAMARLTRDWTWQT